MGTSSRLYSVVNANVDQAINYLKSMHVLASNRRQILMVFFLSIGLCGVLRRRSLPKSPVLLPRNLSLAAFLPLYVVTKIWHWVHGVTSNISFWYRGISVKTHGIEECNFADLKEFDSILSHVGGFGHRSTGSEAHENLLQWIEAKISNTPNITSRHEAFDILRWSTQDGASLRDAGEFSWRLNQLLDCASQSQESSHFLH
ncbi:hypothetical protein N7456_013337 [Penicillium angulare]|uniref:Uncharacterized protein n=1 Tax=Penicillium angulare TaxID=116970 RepID=A0A9W9EFZ7_9EURO|nr:hypothetical protein N7456_013337 [Penicillium angulare]